MTDYKDPKTFTDSMFADVVIGKDTYQIRRIADYRLMIALQRIPDLSALLEKGRTEDEATDEVNAQVAERMESVVVAGLNKPKIGEDGFEFAHLPFMVAMVLFDRILKHSGLSVEAARELVPLEKDGIEISSE